MQKQPTPKLDPDRNGHFLKRVDALAQCKSESAYTDLSDLPSVIGSEQKKDVTNKAARDIQVSRDAGLKSWDSHKVRCFLTCSHCGKRRLVYSKLDADYYNAEVALTQKLESVAGRYTCGDLLFEDSHPLSKKLVQKQALTCELPIEKSYYINEGRSVKLKKICVHCGEESKEGFLLDTDQLKKRCLTKGYKCCPICVPSICSQIHKLQPSSHCPSNSRKWDNTCIP